MKELLLAILIACSLGLGGCTEQPESTGNKQLDDALGVKTEEKIKEPKKDKKEKKEEKKTEKEKSESKTKTKTKKEYKQSTNEDVAETAKRRNFVISTCLSCGDLIHEDDNFKEYRDSYVCEKCYNNAYLKCMDCGKTTNSYDKDVLVGSDGVRCKECSKKYEEGLNVEHCSKCGKKMKTTDTSEYTYDDNGNIVCLDCYFAENDQIGDSEFAD